MHRQPFSSGRAHRAQHYWGAVHLNGGFLEDTLS